MDVAANGGAKILVELAEKNASSETPKSVVLHHEKALTLTLIKSAYFACARIGTCLNVRNPRFETSLRRDDTLDDSCVFTYRMARITGDAPSHCFAPLHSRLG